MALCLIDCVQLHLVVGKCKGVFCLISGLCFTGFIVNNIKRFRLITFIYLTVISVMELRI
jgi:hypothetical protein